MGHLRVAVLGPPEIFHGDRHLTFALRKAQALLLYLAVEGGLHSRAKLAALLWPDAAPDAARKQLRSALLLLRSVLAHADGDASHPSHVLSQRESLGLNPDASMELDLDIIGRAYEQSLRLPTAPLGSQRVALIEQTQRALALARAPFLDGFWLREETGFDTWHTQQERHWHVRVLQLFDRLSSWQEAVGELEAVRVTLARWLAFDPLSEEAYRRSMRTHLARGDPTAALRDYATFRERLAAELQAQPSADTAALAAYVRATATATRTSRPTHPSASLTLGQPTTLAAPLVGRGGAFTQLLTCFEQARQGRPQAVLLEGEAGIGKSRLAQEFGDWARAQGADVLSGQAFEMGGRLPYHPVVEALRQRRSAIPICRIQRRMSSPPSCSSSKPSRDLWTP
jgi:DNA-binding SARP family transcriptional activator